MARRPDSIPEARRAMREALQQLNNPSRQYPEGRTTYCQDRPVPFTEVRQTPEEARRLCGRGSVDECPLLRLCETLGFTESVYADDMVYGGLTWRRGLPLLTPREPKRELPKIKS